MMRGKYSVTSRLIALMLSTVMVFSILPALSLQARAADITEGILSSQTVSDPSTMDAWKKTAFNPTNLSTEHAGGVWTDKSVLTQSAAFAQGSALNGLGIQMNKDNLLVVLSALAANSVVSGSGTTPSDTMFVLDISGSMSDTDLRSMVTATNNAIHTLLTSNEESRVGVVVYASEATVLLPLDRYTPVTDKDSAGNSVIEYIEYASSTIRAGRVATSTGSGSSGNNRPNYGPGSMGGNQTTTTYAYITNSKGTEVKTSLSTGGGTYIQGGLWAAWQQFNAATAVGERAPVLVLMSDGAPTFVTNDFNNVPSKYESGNGNSSEEGEGFLTQLTAAYVKAKMAEKYSSDTYKTNAYVYTVGLGLSTNGNTVSVAEAVLNTTKTHANMAALWNQYAALANANKKTMSVAVHNSGYNANSTANVTVTYNATVSSKDQMAYADKYFSAKDASQLSATFKEIVNEISLRSSYNVTRVTGSDLNADGYVTFVDEIGSGMEVKDIKGIIAGDTLYTGAKLAQAMIEGAFGTSDAPTTLGDNMIWSLKQRLGITDTETVRALARKAYAAGQIAYNAETGAFSNYIGWFADADGNYVGFWDNMDPNAVVPQGAAYANLCYGMLGTTTAGQTAHASDMMYIVVQVSKPVTNGKVLENSPQTVTFRVPASLLPTVTYQIHVELDGDGDIIADSATIAYNAATPIHLVYEVGVHSSVTPENIINFLRPGYRAKDANGNYYLYTNAWNWTPTSGEADLNNPPRKDNELSYVLKDTALNTITYAYFEPSEANEHYYFATDSVVYADTNGTVYTGANRPSGKLYYRHVIYTATDANQSGDEKDATVTVHYEELSEYALSVAKKASDNSWYIPAGTLRRATHSHDLEKTENVTGSFSAVRHQLVDAALNGDDTHAYEFVYMGNNGRITYAPAQGIQLSKTMNDNSQPEVAFTFDVALTAPAGTTLAGAYQTLHVDAMGNETIGNASVSGNKLTVSLKPGESIYILDLPTGTTYQVTERKATGYLESASVGATGVVANNTVKTVSFVNKVRGTGSLRVVKTVTYFNGAVKNNASANNKFPVTVTLTDGLDAYVGKVTVDGQEKDVTNGQITFDIVDGQTVLITNIPDGVAYTVVEGAVPEGYAFNANASVGLTGTVTTGGAAALLANTYTPGSVEIKDTNPSVVVDVSKTLETHQQNVDFTFEFKLQQLDTVANEWVDVTIGGQKLTTQINMTAAGTKDAVISLAGLTFDKAGVYDFRVVETEGSIAGMTYDRTFHDFEIVVTDTDLDGQLEIDEVNAVQHAVVDWDANKEMAQVTTDFTNTYEVGSTKLTIQANKILKDLTVVAGSPAKDKVLKDGQFTFQMYKTDSAFAIQGINPEEAKNGVRGDVIFPTQTYTQADTYYYVIKEVNEAKPGYTYDNAVYKVTVTVEPVEGQLQVTKVLVQKNEEAAADVTANISANVLSANTITFENAYKAEPVSVTLGGNKTLNGWNIKDKMFTFVLENAAGGEIARVENVGGSYTFPQIDYIVEGTSTYTISEVCDGENGYTYDETEYHVTVVVTDNGAGQLVAEVTYTKDGVPVDSPDFVNSYKAEETAPVVLGGFKELLVDTNLFTRVLKDGEFSFVLKDESDNEVETVKNVGDAFTFTGLTFDKAGAYKYTISEVVGSRGGVTYDQTIYNVTVTVTDSGSGKLTAEISYEAENAPVDPEDVIFTNRYAAEEAKLVLAGKKVMVGRELQADEFEFVLLDSEGKELDRKTNDADGNITFDELKYQGVGVHTYTIAEVKNDKGGVTYDETEYAVTVTVRDNGEGQLVTVVDIPDKGDIVADFQFFNRYQADSVTVDIAGDKVLEDLSSLTDKTLNDFVFQFVLEDAEGNVIETVSDNGNGFNFTDLKYDEVGEYIYYITEKENGIAGMTYDYSKYRVTVEITDEVKDGQLEAKVTYAKAEDAESDIYESVTAVSFHNIYKAKATSVSFGGVKVLNGGLNLKANDFTFILKAEDGMELQTVKNGEDGRFVFQSIEYTAEGTYVYTLEEKNDGKDLITYDTTKYTLTVNVEDKDGELKATTVVTKGEETVTDYGFTNIYTPEDVETILSIQKILENKSEETMGLNGFIFQLLEAEAEEAVTATSDDEGKAEFTLSFSAADVGKTYIYKLSEKAGDVEDMTYDDTVYEIKVVVSQNAETGELVLTVTKDDEAIDGSMEFTNVYAPVSEEPPKTADDFNMILWSTLCLGAAVMLAVLVIGKKQFVK